MTTTFTGLLPAAGQGTRLAPFQSSKELLPVSFEPVPELDGGIRPKIVSEYALESLVNADVRRCFVIIAPWKQELVTYFGSGGRYNMTIAYLYQEIARGVPPALDLAYPWVAEHNVVFTMPDTIFYPRNCLASLRQFFTETYADLALGVFPTDEAERFGPVLSEGNSVVAVYDKCPEPPVQNTWGVAIWGPLFTSLLHSELDVQPEPDKEESLGSYFDLAVRAGLTVKALEFTEGSYLDVGTPQGLRCAIERLRWEHVQQ